MSKRTKKFCVEHNEAIFLQEYKVSEVHAEADGEDQLIKLVNYCVYTTSTYPSYCTAMLYTCTCGK